MEWRPVLEPVFVSIQFVWLFESREHLQADHGTMCWLNLTLTSQSWYSQTLQTNLIWKTEFQFGNVANIHHTLSLSIGIPSDLLLKDCLSEKTLRHVIISYWLTVLLVFHGLSVCLKSDVTESAYSNKKMYTQTMLPLYCCSYCDSVVSPQIPLPPKSLISYDIVDRSAESFTNSFLFKWSLYYTTSEGRSEHET